MVRDKRELQDSQGRHRRRDGPIQMPWSDEGWYTDEYHAERDQVLDKKVEAVGKGLNPYGYYTDRPGLAISPMMHNPYFSFVLAGAFAWLGWFIFDKLIGVLWLAIVLCAFFGLIAILAVVISAFRIPGWHRARKVAKAHVTEHGGEFPSELKWYT